MARSIPASGVVTVDNGILYIIVLALGVGFMFVMKAADALDTAADAVESMAEDYKRVVDAQLTVPVMAGFEQEFEEIDTEQEPIDPGYPNPTDADLADPRFDVIWNAIKRWDIGRYPDGTHSGATGSDVMHILRAIDLSVVEDTHENRAAGLIK